jgi:hypothetical protein
MPNTTEQLVVNPLFRRNVLFFSVGIGEDVLGNLFSSKDLFRKQVNTGEKQRGVNHEIANKRKKRIDRNSLSNGTLLWWSDAHLDGLLSFVRHGFGVFSSGTREKMSSDGSVCEWICRVPRGLFY